MIPAATFKIIIDSVVWAFKHTMRNIAEMGLNILLEMWNNIEKASAEVAQSTFDNLSSSESASLTLASFHFRLLPSLLPVFVA